MAIKSPGFCDSCRIPAPAPCVTYSGKHHGVDVHVVWSGHDHEHGVDLIGTVPASLATYLACQALNPDLIISAGTAGGFKARVCVSFIQVARHLQLNAAALLMIIQIQNLQHWTTARMLEGSPGITGVLATF